MERLRNRLVSGIHSSEARCKLRLEKDEITKYRLNFP